MVFEIEVASSRLRDVTDVEFEAIVLLYVVFDFERWKLKLMYIHVGIDLKFRFSKAITSL